MKRNFRAARFKDAYTLDGIVCLPLLYILMTHLSSVYTQKPARISAHTYVQALSGHACPHEAREGDIEILSLPTRGGASILSGRPARSVFFNVRA